MKNIIIITTITFSICTSVKSQNPSGLYFDGIDDQVFIGDIPELNIESTITLEAWIRADEFQTNLFGRIIDKFHFYNQEGYNLIVNNGHLWLDFFNMSGESFGIYGDDYLLDNQWHHVAGTYDGDSLKLYVDGVLDYGYSIGPQTIRPTSNVFAIGNNDDGAGYLPFHGDIDEVRVWDIARTAEEISTFMHCNLQGNESGLIGYWQFNENSGTIAQDGSTENNSGDINGAQWIDDIAFAGNNDCEIVSIINNNSTAINSYPSPVNCGANLHIGTFFSGVNTIDWIDLSGRIAGISNIIDMNHNIIKVPELAPGMYLLCSANRYYPKPVIVNE